MYVNKKNNKMGFPKQDSPKNTKTNKQDQSKGSEDHQAAHDKLKEARRHAKGALSLIRRAQRVKRIGGDGRGRVAHPRSDYSFQGTEVSRSRLQLASPKVRPTHNTKLTGETRKMVGDLRKMESVSGDYSPSGITNRFNMNTPMPSMDFTETAVNHARYGTGSCIVGSEFLTSLSVEGAAGRGSILEAFPFNPRYWGGTRIQVMSQLWNRYIIKNMVLEYVPIINATVNGAIQMWPDYDPDSFPSYITGDGAMRKSLAYQNSVQGQVFSYVRSVFHNSDMSEAYFLEPNGTEVRLMDQGVFYVMASSDLAPPEGETNLVLGNILVHYEVDFFLRSLVSPEAPIDTGVLTDGALIMPDVRRVTATGAYVSLDAVEGFPILIGSYFNSAPAALPWGDFVALGNIPLGTVLFVTAQFTTVPGIFGNWAAYGNPCQIAWSQQPSFWGKVTGVSITAATLDPSERVWLALYPTFQAAVEGPAYAEFHLDVNVTGADTVLSLSSNYNSALELDESGTAGDVLTNLLDFSYTTFPAISTFSHA